MPEASEVGNSFAGSPLMRQSGDQCRITLTSSVNKAVVNVINDSLVSDSVKLSTGHRHGVEDENSVTVWRSSKSGSLSSTNTRRTSEVIPNSFITGSVNISSKGPKFLDGLKQGTSSDGSRQETNCVSNSFVSKSPDSLQIALHSILTSKEACCAELVAIPRNIPGTAIVTQPILNVSMRKFKPPSRVKLVSSDQPLIQDITTCTSSCTSTGCEKLSEGPAAKLTPNSFVGDNTSAHFTVSSSSIANSNTDNKSESSNVHKKMPISVIDSDLDIANFIDNLL